MYEEIQILGDFLSIVNGSMYVIKPCYISGSDFLFSPLLMARIDPETLFNMCQINRGAFVVVRSV
jgi:hypothetical protein